jgi:hypothetical protein
MIDPAALKLESLPWMPLSAKTGLVDQPGVYFAIDSCDVIQYVGRSVGVRGRWKRHHRYKDILEAGVIKICFLACSAEELPYCEAEMIVFFSPPLNIAMPSEDLLAVASLRRAYPKDREGLIRHWAKFVDCGIDIGIEDMLRLCKGVPDRLAQSLFVRIDSEQTYYSVTGEDRIQGVSHLCYELRVLASENDAMEFVSSLIGMVGVPPGVALVKGLQLLAFAVLGAEREFYRDDW